MRITILAITFMLLASGCSLGLFAEEGAAYEVSYIAEVSTVPEEVHAGDTVLIRYRIAREIIHDNGIYTLNVNSAELTSRVGEITPVLASDYAPGGSIPDFNTARSNYRETQLIHNGEIHHDLLDVWQEPYYYMLYQAPDFACEEEVFFYLGGGGPSSNKNRHTLKLKVRE